MRTAKAFVVRARLDSVKSYINITGNMTQTFD